MKAAQQERALTKAFISLNEAMNSINTALTTLKTDLDALVQMKSQNAELEREVLNKINNYL